MCEEGEAAGHWSGAAAVLGAQVLSVRGGVRSSSRRTAAVLGAEALVHRGVCRLAFGRSPWWRGGWRLPGFALFAPHLSWSALVERLPPGVRRTRSLLI